MENIGRVFKEYTDNFKDSFRKLTDLQEHLNTLADVSGLGTALGDFESSFSETERSHDTAEQALNATNQPQWSGWKQLGVTSGDFANIWYSGKNEPVGNNLYEHHSMIRNNNNHSIDIVNGTDDATGNAWLYSPSHLNPGDVALASWTDNKPHLNWHLTLLLQ